MELGMIGLGRMGANMVRRLMRAGIRCVAHDRSQEAVATLVAEGAVGADSLEALVAGLAAPRHIWLMVPAALVDATIDQLAPLLAPGDTIIDGGNSLYQDDLARAERLRAKGLHYMDCGVSGGVFGLERGYCLMVGGERETVARMTPGDVEMTCQTALALSIWRRQSLEPAAREILGSDVVQIDHMGAYACRNVNNGVGSSRISAHAQEAALDFAGVRLRDGRRITVTKDWSGDTAEARFLRRIRDDACRIFGTTLSPDYNAVHHDHLHL